MSTIKQMIETYEFNRGRTLATLDQISETENPQQVLGWRPGDGRAHIGWQLMHIAVTEDLFASERLAPDKSGRLGDVWSRFRGGSTPDDNIPSADQIRDALLAARQNLLDTLTRFSEDRLGEIPPAFQQRGWTLRDVLHVIAWHEAHHQGQAHITHNLYRAQHAG